MKYTKPMNIRLEHDTHKRLKAYALSQGDKVSAVIRKLIEQIIPPTKKNRRHAA